MLLVAGVSALAIMLSGCGGTVSDQGGFGLPSLDAAEREEVRSVAGAEAMHLEGSLGLLSNGCFVWSGDDEADGAWLVWPDAAQPDPRTGDRVVLPDGSTAVKDAPLTATGSLVALSDLPGGSVDSYFGSFGTFCGADERGVLMLDEVALAR